MIKGSYFVLHKLNNTNNFSIIVVFLLMVVSFAIIYFSLPASMFFPRNFSMTPD